MKGETMLRGNCYVTSEAIYHLTGGRFGPWRPMVARTQDGKETHWFLYHKGVGTFLDVTGPNQFSWDELQYLYRHARGCGFLTRQPSKRARILMAKMQWQPIES